MSVIAPKTAIRYLLVSSAAVAAIIGTRCGPLSQTQRTVRPYVILTTVAAPHDYHLRGASGRVVERVQVDAYADTANGITLLANAIRNRLSGYRGTVTVAASATESEGTLVLDFVELVDESDGAGPSTVGADAGVFHYRLDFRVSSAEPIPSLT